MLETIHAFCELVKTHSYTRAAKQLGISTVMMTRRIQKLEQTIGNTLFVRSNRQITLTAAGQMFLSHAQAILKHYQQGQQAIESLKGDIRGNLKIGIPASINYHYLIPNLANWCDQYPDITVNSVCGNHLLNMQNDQFDLVIHCGQLNDSPYYATQLCQWYKLTAASPKYLASHSPLRTPDDLQLHDCIDHSDNYKNSWPYLVDGLTKRYFIQPRFRTNSSLNLCQLACEHQGIVFLPDFCLQHALNEGALTVALAPYQLEPLPMYAVYPNAKSTSLKTKLFIEFLISLFKTHK